MMTILSGVSWCLIIVLICISLSSNVEHLSMCLLARCMSSFEIRVPTSFARFLIALFAFLMLGCMSCLYILEINPLSVALFVFIFSHSEGCLLIYCFLLDNPIYEVSWMKMKTQHIKICENAAKAILKRESYSTKILLGLLWWFRQ